MARIKRSASYGIKELKDRASEIVQNVVGTGRPAVISKNDKDIAMIVPIQKDPIELFYGLGFIKRIPEDKWSTLKLIRIHSNATAAIKAIVQDRGD